MAANNQTLYIYRGQEGEVVPDDATHVLVDLSVKVVLREAFYEHPNIVEVDCRNAEKVEEWAFAECPSLRRVKIPGVITVEGRAFAGCEALTDVECDKLERIGEWAFASCNLRNINLPSAEIVEESAFYGCNALTDVKFGDKLERIGGSAFINCPSLERIAIPLKYGMIDEDDDDDYCDVFIGCENLRRVDLLEGGVHETIAALHLDEWKNDMNATIDAINRILPNTSAGEYNDDGDYVQVAGEKSRAIQTWIRSVLREMDDYEQQHRNILTEATSILVEEVDLPQDIVINNILPFLELPSYFKFELEDGGYEGSWKDDMRHGEGKRTYADGRVYVGNWKDDKKHGFGMYTFPDGEMYEGDWVDGKKHGFGKYTFLVLGGIRVYEGNWKDGKRDGKGKMTYAVGEKYEGNWIDGLAQGKGKYTSPDGEVCEGIWEDDTWTGWGE